MIRCKRVLFATVLLFSLTIAFSQKRFELPLSCPTNQIVNHKAYVLSYSEEHEQAEWVAYILCRSRTDATEARANKFMVDPLVSTGSATDKDYAKSGYDRGHLAPAADMAWSEITMRESFYYSNMSPQLPAFNRGIWKSAETFVRNLAIKQDTIYVVTGPVLKAKLSAIGHNKLSVPELYYKAVLCLNPKPHMIAFLIPNRRGEGPLHQYVVTVDSIEALTGIDFFHLLPDDIENKIESEKNGIW